MTFLNRSQDKNSPTLSRVRLNAAMRYHYPLVLSIWTRPNNSWCHLIVTFCLFYVDLISRDGKPQRIICLVASSDKKTFFSSYTIALTCQSTIHSYQSSRISFAVCLTLHVILVSVIFSRIWVKSCVTDTFDATGRWYYHCSKLCLFLAPAINKSDFLCATGHVQRTLVPLSAVCDSIGANPYRHL